MYGEIHGPPTSMLNTNERTRILRPEETNMPMTRPQPVNTLLVATVVAAIHTGTAVLFLPLLSLLMLCWGAAPVQFKGLVSATSNGMLLVLAAPLFFGVFGFLAGGLAALGHNLFAQHQRQRTLEIEETVRTRTASLGNVA